MALRNSLNSSLNSSRQFTVILTEFVPQFTVSIVQSTDLLAEFVPQFTVSIVQSTDLLAEFVPPVYCFGCGVPESLDQNAYFVKHSTAKLRG